MSVSLCVFVFLCLWNRCRGLMREYGWEDKIGLDSVVEELLLMRMDLNLTRAAEILLADEHWDAHVWTLIVLHPLRSNKK